MYFEGYGYDPSVVMGQNLASLNMADQQPGLIQRMKEGDAERGRHLTKHCPPLYLCCIESTILKASPMSGLLYYCSLVILKLCMISPE